MNSAQDSDRLLLPSGLLLLALIFAIPIVKPTMARIHTGFANPLRRTASSSAARMEIIVKLPRRRLADSRSLLEVL